MAKLYKLNKPYGVVCQFSGEGNTLASLINIKDIYPVGRLDKNSEGLLLLTDDGKLQHKLSNPKFNKEKKYVVQVEGDIEEYSIRLLSQGVELKDGITKPARVCRIDEPNWLWERNPPIRVRKLIPTSWLEIIISEGRNHQIRRMTAHVGYPTLRLIRTSIDNFHLNQLKPGQYERV